jgi:hypothetical protein
MTRILVLALTAAASAASAQNIYRCVTPDGHTSYSDQPPTAGRCMNVPPLGGSGPSTVPQGPLPKQSLPRESAPSVGAPSTIPSAAVPGPGSRSTPGRAPDTAGDRFINVPAGEQRIDGDATRRNVMQGERAREAEGVRLNVEPGEAARMRRDMQTAVPSGEAARDRRDMQTGMPDDETRREREAVRLNQ